jgi:hypothetical protein
MSPPIVPARETEQQNAVNYEISKSAGIASEEYRGSDEEANPVPASRSRMDMARSWLGYIKTKQFWTVLLFGYFEL